MFFITSVCRPGFRAVEKGGEYDCSLNFQFDIKAKSFLLPNIDAQSPKGAACVGYSVVNLDVGTAEEGNIKVCEGPTA